MLSCFAQLRSTRLITVGCEDASINSYRIVGQAFGRRDFANPSTILGVNSTF